MPSRLKTSNKKKKVTLFFNLSHLNGANTDHFMYVAGRKYPLARVADAPDVLAAYRKSNALLRVVADPKITHHAVDVDVASDTVALAYLTCNENSATGTWEMTGMSFQIPGSALVHAYKQARILTPKGPLPLSGKRKLYGAPAATSLKDLQDETQLIDTMSFAQAIVGLHPDILSAEASSAGHIRARVPTRRR